MRWLEPGAAEGLRLGGEAAVPVVWPERIVVAFAGFRDGRGFSLGALLRERGFAGELVASGDLIADHAPMLKRVGFDAVELPVGSDVAEWARAEASFSAAYQAANDAVVPVWALRRSRSSSSPDGAASAAEMPGPSRISADAGGFEGGAAGSPGSRSPGPEDDGEQLDARVAALNAEFRDAPAEAILRAALERFPGRAAVLSSFGAEAAVSLHMAAAVDPATPVLFLDTERHFVPTLSYRDRLAERLGLTDVRTLKPRDAETHDPKGDLWRTDPDACCALRKVRPLAEVAPGFDVLITGRKRFHGGSRVRLPAFERVGDQIRVNPLVNWSADEIEGYFAAHDLPRHPLTDGGYRSIGCWPCTQPSSEEENVRAGRWAGLDKTECGIHMPSRWVADADRRAS